MAVNELDSTELDSTELDIAEVVAASGIPSSTLHLWERRGLIRSTRRVGLRRQYDAAIIQRLAIIVTCQRAGFTLQEIVELLAPDAFDDGKEALDDKLVELRLRREELDLAIMGLEHAVACPEPSPMHCEGFLAKLDGVLPVRVRQQARAAGRK